MAVKLDDTVCRVCLSSSGNIQIFDGCGKDDQFRYCTSLEPSEDDGLPSKLCKKCNDHLKVAYDFRFQAIYAENYLRKTIFLPSLKKEDDDGATAIISSDERKGDDELDENMAEIDILLATHAESVEEPDDDNDDMNNSGFDDDDDSPDEDAKQVEVIGMETFEKEQREQKEQKVKIELTSVPAPLVSSAVSNTATYGPHLDEIPLVSPQYVVSGSIGVQQTHVDINEIQHFTTSSPYSQQSVQEHETNRSLQLEILPIMKGDQTHHEYNTTAAYDSYNAPTHLQYQQAIPIHLQYEPTTNNQDPTLPCHEQTPTNVNYNFTYQPEYSAYGAQTTDLGSEEQAVPQVQVQLPQQTIAPSMTENQSQPTSKTESEQRIEDPKPKKAKRDTTYRRDKIECNICGSIFTHLNSLKTHLLKHSGEKPFKCEFCNKAFARKTVLNIHRRLHTGEKPYKCFLCSSAYVTKEALTRHLQKDHEQEVGANFRKDKVSYICSLCNKSRCSKYSLASHMKTHSTEAKARRRVIRKTREKSSGSNGPVTNNVPMKYSCKICQKGFPNKWELSTHAESHDLNKTFECDVCERTFEKKFQLLYHLQTHDNGEELVKAKVQPSVEKQKKEPEPTTKGEKTKDLPKCSEKSSTSPKKRSRRKTKQAYGDSGKGKDVAIAEDEEANEEEDDNDDDNDEDYNHVKANKLAEKRKSRAKRENLKKLRASSRIECHICEAVFTHPTSLKTHMLVHSGERPFKCDHCDKSFARKTVLNIHRRLHTGEKPYKCPLCVSACVTKDALMRHMSKDHDDDKEADRIKFTCGICQKAMGTKYSLQAHMKLHEQNSTPDADVKFTCNTCSESFNTKLEYTKHMEVHDSHMNFQCDICQVTFEKKFKLLFHLQTHKIEDLPCKKCGETFTIRENLIQHIKLQHMDPRNMDFQCPHCNIVQYDTRDLKLHMSTVHDISMGGINSCDLCGESYSTAAEYYKHMHDKHDKISKTCNECDKYFDSRKTFDKHILAHYM